MCLDELDASDAGRHKLGDGDQAVAEPMDDVPLLDRVGDRLDIDAAARRSCPRTTSTACYRDVSQLDYAEIAQVLGIPAGTVRSRIARGR